MDIKVLFDNIKNHPVAAVIVGIVMLFIVYAAAKKSTVTQPAATPVATPAVSETYAQQYNSYPSGGPTNVVVGGVATPPIPPTPPPPTPPPPAPPPVVTTPAYHGVLTQPGSPHPANIGPWVSGRDIQYQGVTYQLIPGPSGRLWGKIISHERYGQQVLMWDGSDYHH